MEELGEECAGGGRGFQDGVNGMDRSHSLAEIAEFFGRAVRTAFAAAISAGIAGANAPEAPCIDKADFERFELVLRPEVESAGEGRLVRLSVEYCGECPVFQVYGSPAEEFGFVVSPVSPESGAEAAPGELEAKRAFVDGWRRTSGLGYWMFLTDLHTPRGWYGGVYFSDSFATDSLKAFLVERELSFDYSVNGPEVPNGILNGLHDEYSFDANMHRLQFHGDRRETTLDIDKYWKLDPNTSCRIQAFMMVHPDIDHAHFQHPIKEKIRIYSNTITLPAAQAYKGSE